MIDLKLIGIKLTNYLLINKSNTMVAFILCYWPSSVAFNPRTVF